MAKTRPLVPDRTTMKPTSFVSPVLKEMRMVALSTSGHGMSASARVRYFNSVLHAEQAAIKSYQRSLARVDVPVRSGGESADSQTQMCAAGGRLRKRKGLRQRDRERPGSSKKTASSAPWRPSFRRLIHSSSRSSGSRTDAKRNRNGSSRTLRRMACRTRL